MKKIFKLTIVSLVILIGLMLFKLYDNNRVKNLDKVLYYNPRFFQEFGVVTDKSLLAEDGPYEWYTKDKEVVEELLEFLNNYEVKKPIKDTLKNIGIILINYSL